jgi:hypothetical protein
MKRDIKKEAEEHQLLNDTIKNKLPFIRYQAQTNDTSTDHLIDHKIEELRVSLATTRPAASTRASSISAVFPRFFTSYGGTRSPVPDNLTPQEYYQDVVPADQDPHGYFIDPMTPMPNGLTSLSNVYGTPACGLLSLVGNTQLNMSKFQERLEKLVLKDDMITAIRDWYHGIRLALLTPVE